MMVNPQAASRRRKRPTKASCQGDHPIIETVVIEGYCDKYAGKLGKPKIRIRTEALELGQYQNFCGDRAAAKRAYPLAHLYFDNERAGAA